MAYLSRAEIDRISIPFVERYKQVCGQPGEEVHRIDPMLMAEKVLGLEVEHQHLSPDGSILGLTSLEPLCVAIFGADDEELTKDLDGKTLLIERDLKDDVAMQGRYHFTVMHEVSHHILGRKYPIKAAAGKPHFYRATQACARGPNRDWCEWQADALASSLLLPAEMVRCAMAHFGLNKRIEILNRLFRVREYEAFTNMAVYLGASKQALAIRMKQLGLLGLNQLENPYSLADVEVG